MATLSPEEFTRLVTLTMPDKVSALVFSPDGKSLAVAAGDKIHLYLIPEKARNLSGTNG